MADAETAAFGGGNGALDAVAFGVAATLVYDVFSATNSSPQTTELFAADRAETLWKYVRLGGLQSVMLVGIMTYRASADGGGLARAAWPIFGGVAAGALMWAMYSHALKAGQSAGDTPAAKAVNWWRPA